MGQEVTHDNDIHKYLQHDNQINNTVHSSHLKIKSISQEVYEF